ncbi:hypothetical protein [Intestinimonas butyriciproducens]|uniref:hypothetical protein n=1 Tax=Intestinimonas butyriciproducens TaxID=1297617 RepID=UPI00189F8CBD|nr:hypothetical protein [Intestinimonas butyriciproducens]
MSEKIIYRLDDEISFRKCSLFEEDSTSRGDCTNFYTKEVHFHDHYFCKQEGLHFHCTKHPEIELECDPDFGGSVLTCPKCRNQIEIGNIKSLISRCLRALNREIFKDATLIRVDDWYTPEIKEKINPAPDYRLITNVKTDKDGDTIVVLYISYVGTGTKVQYFIKPEKGQLTSDHKDMDPAKIISKIEVTLKDRTLTQAYHEDADDKF